RSGSDPFTISEMFARKAAAACGTSGGYSCEKPVHVGLFFDGTNNNLERDKADTPPSHTNIVTLYETFKDKPDDGFYRFYVPGVGTKFMEVGESTESNDGKAYGKGGDQRINWALIQLVNSIHRAVYGKLLLRDYDAGVEAGLWPLHSQNTTSAARDDKRRYFVEGLRTSESQAVYQAGKDTHCSEAKAQCEVRRSELARRKARLQKGGQLTPDQAQAIDEEIAGLDLYAAALDRSAKVRSFRPLLARLTEALERRPLPKIKLINLSVFGFSRGAAQARAFCNFLQDILTPDPTGTIKQLRGKDAPAYALAGIPLRVQFLGLFDTVASAGMADASPFWRGFGGWANGTMDIPHCVERTVHYVAAHELRLAFPSSSTRLGPRKYPNNCLEVIYPGAHSDVGGGYNPGAQGKSRGGRKELLSQIPLTHMYREARLAGVPLLSEGELGSMPGGGAVIADMQIAPETARLYDAYLRDCPVKADVAETMMKAHTQAYWRWREQVSDKGEQVSKEDRFNALESVRLASPQDKRDLVESEQDYRLDRAQLRKALKLWDEEGDPRLMRPAYEDCRQALSRPPVSAAVSDFFDKLVHDSHATFYMLGPTTALDRQNLYEALLEKKAKGERLSNVERRIVDGGRNFPVLTDADTPELLATMSWYSHAALVLFAGQNTRRETGGHLHYRRVFDAS
uniref:T6SS phospholipase effector Tle1-like catalytic domain-containing protein n=2 Tax=uncultured Pseudacidovorax sp. TaxID=679313 RepID=UPI0025E34837